MQLSPLRGMLASSYTAICFLDATALTYNLPKILNGFNSSWKKAIDDARGKCQKSLTMGSSLQNINVGNCGNDVFRYNPRLIDDMLLQNFGGENQSSFGTLGARSSTPAKTGGFEQATANSSTPVPPAVVVETATTARNTSTVNGTSTPKVSNGSCRTCTLLHVLQMTAAGVLTVVFAILFD